MLVTMSSGLAADPPGIFSAAAITPTILIGKSNLAAAKIVPKTEAAPHISYFMPIIPAGGFKEFPPVSKVMPFPTKTIGLLVVFAP